MRCLALVMLAACTDSGPDFPVTTQGGAPPGGAVTVPTVIIGRVCVLTDPRLLTSCITTGAQNLTVTVGNQVATTGPSGGFVVNAPSDTTTPNIIRTVTVTGTGIIPSSQVVTPNLLVPVLNENLFSQVLAANGIVLTPGSGSIIASVTRGGIPVQGVTAISTPSPAFGPFFDGTSPTAFTLNGTGAQGVALFAGFAPNVPVNVTFTDAARSSETTVGGVQVINGGITFVEGVLP